MGDGYCPVKPEITIGLPVWNAAPFLEDALRSIFAQTFSDWELIAVDDGSRDGSAAILRRLRDPRVRVIADGEHRGLGARLNQIVAEAAGPFIARMDADDLMHPERLAREHAFLRANAEVDVVGCGVISFDAAEQPISVRQSPAGHAAITAAPLTGFGIVHASVLGRAEWWHKHRYNEQNRGCEDWELWFDSRGQSTFANIPEPLYFYREQQAYSFRGYAGDKLQLAELVWKKRRPGGGLASLTAAAGHIARIGVYAVAQLLGRQGTLIRRRGVPPGEEHRRFFEEGLRRVRSTALPA